MTIENFVDEAHSFELSEIKDWSLEKLLKYMQVNKIERVYITKNNYPIFIFNPIVIIDIFINNLILLKIEEFLKEKEKIDVIDANKHLIETYNFMRNKKLEYAPVVKNNRLIGEISFNTLSLKISFIAIKDPLTNTYNEKYFNVLIEEYNEIASSIGIIMVKVLNVSIYEGLYGIDFVNKVLKKISEILIKSTRNVDFIFRNDDMFKILTFNNAEITMKIKQRIENKISSFTIDDIHITCEVLATHVPEIDSNIILALEELERKLIKRD